MTRTRDARKRTLEKIRGIRLGSIGGRTRSSSPNAERDDEDEDNEDHRWISLVLGICVQLCAGSLYAVNA